MYHPVLGSAHSAIQTRTVVEWMYRGSFWQIFAEFLQSEEILKNSRSLIDREDQGKTTTSLANANKLHVGICVTNIFGQGWEHGQCCEDFCVSLITMQNLVAVLYHMHTCRRSQKFWGAGAPLTWDGDRAWPCWNMHLPTNVTLPDLVGLGQMVWV